MKSFRETKKNCLNTLIYITTSGDLLNLIYFLDARKQRVVLMVNIYHGQALKQEFLKDQFLVLFFFSIFINDSSISNPKLFAGDTSLFSLVQGIILSAKNLNYDLRKVNKWTFQWKMNCNPDPNKQAHEVIFPGNLINQITHH